MPDDQAIQNLRKKQQNMNYEEYHVLHCFVKKSFLLHDSISKVENYL